MADEFTIVGLNPNNDRRLYEIVKNVMQMYKIKKIKVRIKQKMNNAVVTPFFGIFIGQPLLDKLSPEELEGILAHEFSHFINRDILSNIFVYFIFAFPMLYTISFLYNPREPSLTVAVGILISIIIWIYGIRVRNWITLQHEIRADREAVIKTKNPNALQRALIIMITEPLLRTEKVNILSVILQSLFLIIRYFFGLTHPQLKERIEYLDFANRILKT